MGQPFKGWVVVSKNGHPEGEVYFEKGRAEGKLEFCNEWTNVYRAGPYRIGTALVTIIDFEGSATVEDAVSHRLAERG